MEEEISVTLEDMKNMLKINNINYGPTLLWGDGERGIVIKLDNNNFLHVEISVCDSRVSLIITCQNDMIKNELIKLGYSSHSIYGKVLLNLGNNLKELIDELVRISTFGSKNIKKAK